MKQLKYPTPVQMREFQDMPESVSPEGLLARADFMRATDPSCARHLELAAQEIRKLRGQPIQEGLEDDELQATHWESRTNDRLKAATLTFRHRKALVGYLIMTPEETYELGTHLIHLYDRLEGIK